MEVLAEKLEPMYAAEAKERQREHARTAPGRKSLTQKVAEVKKNEGEARKEETHYSKS